MSIVSQPPGLPPPLPSTYPHPTLAHVLLLLTRIQKQDAPWRLDPEPLAAGGRGEKGEGFPSGAMMAPVL